MKYDILELLFKKKFGSLTLLTHCALSINYLRNNKNKIYVLSETLGYSTEQVGGLLHTYI